MIDDENHPRMQQALKGLELLLARFQLSRLDARMLDQIMDMVKDHRQRWRIRGVNFPVLVPLVNPRRKTIQLVRADLDKVGIRTQVRNFIIANPDLSVPEITMVAKAAWPDLHKGWLDDTSEEFQFKMDRSLERQVGGALSGKVEVDTTQQDLIDQAIAFDPSVKEHYEEVE